MGGQTHFRLFDLPGDLVEDISFLFFNIHEVHELLTVSSGFHDLFARRLWWKLDSRVFTLSEPKRTMAFERYGKLVRFIDLDPGTCFAIKPHINNGVSVCDILSVFPDITTLWIGDTCNILMPSGLQFVDFIMCFPKLFKLNIKLSNENEPFDLATLANALNHRQNSSSTNSIEHLSLSYSGRPTDSPWTGLSNFVQMDFGNCVIKLEFPPWFTPSTRPTQSELQVLGKFFMSNPGIERQWDARYCYATLNRSWFRKPLDMHNYCIYPQIHRLSLRTCCMSSDTYDYCDIVPSNFPSLQSINITGHECENMVSNSYPPAWKTVLLQDWPHLSELVLSFNMTCEQLLDILQYNRRLTGLYIELHPKMLDDNNTFNLATILPLLPKLQRLSIGGNRVMKIDYSPDYDDSEILARSQLNYILFSKVFLSSRIYKFVYSLPNLGTLLIHNCNIYSVGTNEGANMDGSHNNPSEIDTADVNGDKDLYNELMATLNTVSAGFSTSNPCAIKQLTLRIRLGDYVWPLDFTLQLIALMPKLQKIIITGPIREIVEAVKVRFPHIKVTYYY
ncbi:hypothetical protein GQ42DRAFT_160497 [Ramicandelaber brevisporus]|nr:hypothetical protein GQ42DRAFT_160497 [Ramicandelaber brevisporus]